MKRERAPRHARFSDEALDTFERCQALRLAGADTNEACMQSTPDYYACLDLSKHLQLKLLGVPFYAVCGGIFETESKPPVGAGYLLAQDWERFYRLRQALLAARRAKP
jgi:hypothetical protein